MSARRTGEKTTRAPRITEMTEDACHALLKRHHVGRNFDRSEPRLESRRISYAERERYILSEIGAGIRFAVRGDEVFEFGHHLQVLAGEVLAK